MERWIKLYSTHNYAEANIIKGMLEENNIHTFILNKQDSIYLLGELEVYVSFHLKDIALRLIDKALLN